MWNARATSSTKTKSRVCSPSPKIRSGLLPCRALTNARFDRDRTISPNPVFLYSSDRFKNPYPFRADVAVFESTYGKRLHPDRSAEESRLVETVASTVGSGSAST